MPAEAAEYGLTSSDGTPVSLEMLGGFDEARGMRLPSPPSRLPCPPSDRVPSSRRCASGR